MMQYLPVWPQLLFSKELEQIFKNQASTSLSYKYKWPITCHYQVHLLVKF